MILLLTWLRLIFLGNYLMRPIVSSNVNVIHHSKWPLLDHDKCGNSNTDRIIGGTNASLGAYPWLARIGYTFRSSNRLITDYKCGGSLINKNYVVTAAHCVVNAPDWMTIDSVRLGEHNTMTNPDCEEDYCADPVQDFKIVSTIFHEGYNKRLFRNDIAIVRLNRPAIYNEFVMPICMPYGPLLEKNFVGETAEVAGWGIYDIEKPQLSTILQTVSLPIMKTTKCKKMLHNMIGITERQICAGGNIGKDSCNGDSGGPLMKVETIDELPRYYIIGLVSFGMERCGSTTRPGVYTKVSHYIKWILDNIYP
ncbi:hypothetical protein KPH14_009652 [Odynerus spinipes]|uniref:limulus clotting factor C n=1 Tax=Odynerus spinipes TaxID=1348599 RepID=A0AAD9RPX9_9HYME|nr:hypothetical protein KPH14_009652 [Odynerus spinipes]